MTDNEQNPTSKTSTEKVDKILCLNKSMIPCKLLYFAMDASNGCFWSFLTLFMLSIGLTITQAGALLSVGGGLVLIEGPLWGIVMDSIKKHRTLLFMFLCLGTTLVHFWCPWLAQWISEKQNIRVCLNVTAKNTGSFSTESNTNCTMTTHLLNQDMLFLAFLLNAVVNSVFFSGLTCYIEGAVMKRVFAGNSGESYGQQKAFGPIGYAFGSFMAGVAIDLYKPEGLSRYTSAFYVFLPLSLMMIPSLYVITKQVDWTYGASDENKTKLSLLSDVLRVLNNLDNFMFITSVFISGLSVTLYEGYLYVYMVDRMIPTKTQLALTTVIATASEAIVYPISAKIIKKIGGPIRSIILGMVVFSLRLLFLSWCTKPWHVFVNQSLRGFGLSLPWAAMIQQIWLIFPKHVTTTAVSLLNNLFFAGSGVLTSVLGGYLYHEIGGVQLFRGMAGLSFTSAILLLFYFEFISQQKNLVVESEPVELGHCRAIDVEEEEANEKRGSA